MARNSVGAVVSPHEISDASQIGIIQDDGQEQLPLPDYVTGVWTCKASVLDQFSNERWQNDVRAGVEKVAVFELPSQQDEANKLFARAHPPGSPEILILRRDPMRSAGKLVLFVLYQEVEYRTLLPGLPTIDSTTPTP